MRLLFIIIAINCIFISCKTKINKKEKNKTAIAPVVDSFPLTINNTFNSPPEYIPKKYGYKPSQSRDFDLIHTKLEVSFDFNKQYLYGTATLKLKPYFYSKNILQLDAKGFDLKNINLLQKSKEIPLKYDYNKQTITIYLDKTYTKEQQFDIEIEYIAKPNELPAGGSAAITSAKGLYFINPLGTEKNKPTQIWTQGEPQSSSCWFPTIDWPNERCTQETHITVDSAYSTLSNGTLSYSTLDGKGKRTDVWEQKLPHAPYLFMMAIGKFAIIKDSWRDVPLTYLVEPKYAPFAKKIFGNTPEMLEFFSNKLGFKYPWAKYAQVVVRDYVSGAMENTSASIFMEALQLDDRELLDKDWDDIIAHELFHQWFGDLVTLESWANLPLNESFADYSEYLWLEYKKGKDEADFHAFEALSNYLSEAKEKREPIIRYYNKSADDMFDSHSYAKGGRILHLLRNTVGDEAFFESLKRYLQNNQFKSVEVHNLRLAFEEVTGQDLNWFFNQWFLSAGHPELKLDFTYKDKKAYLSVEQLQDTNYFPIFKLKTEVRFCNGSKNKSFPIDITKINESFEFALEEEPENWMFDPNNLLPAEIQFNKKESAWLSQFQNASEAVNRNFALFKLAENKTGLTAKKALFQALKDSFWMNREFAIETLGSMGALLGDTLLNELTNIARNDPKSLVRAAALEVIGNVSPEKHVDLFENGINDRSYTVVSRALDGLISSKSPKAGMILSKLENIENSEILVSISKFYAQNGDTTKYNWFLEKLPLVKGFNDYNFIQNFGVYLLKSASPHQKEIGIKQLENWARTSPSFGGKISAYQILGLFSDLPGIQDMRKDILEKESNPRLKSIFQNL